MDLLEPELLPIQPPPPPPPPADTRAEEEEREAKAAAELALRMREAGAPRDGGVARARTPRGRVRRCPHGRGEPTRPRTRRSMLPATARRLRHRRGHVPRWRDRAGHRRRTERAARSPGHPRRRGRIQADVVLVMVVVNAEVIRQNPVGAQMGYLLRGIPQWDEFMSGTDIDPVRDTDWVVISGPSLINTSRDVMLDPLLGVRRGGRQGRRRREPEVRPRRPVRRRACRASRRRSRTPTAPSGSSSGRSRTCSPSSRRASPRRSRGSSSRRGCRRTSARARRSYLRVVNPHHPMPEIPTSITEMRLRVVPRRRPGGRRLHRGRHERRRRRRRQAADGLRRMVRRHNDAFTVDAHARPARPRRGHERRAASSRRTSS